MNWGTRTNCLLIRSRYTGWVDAKASSSLTMSTTEQDDDWGDFLDAGNGGESTVVAETSTVEDTFGTFDGEIFGDAKARNNGVEDSTSGSTPTEGHESKQGVETSLPAESEKKDDDTDEWGDFLDVGETGVSSTNFVDKTGSTVVGKG